mmetsp:Transcript_10760/g.44501  ORF Transcript_10760/g.44501 Transcript_10760/m.44501 type:complete len:266 (+) Transcript_10760:802-1599(+)
MRPPNARSRLHTSFTTVTSPSVSMAFCTAGSARISSSITSPRPCAGWATRSDEVECFSSLYCVRKLTSRPDVLARSRSLRGTSTSLRPMSSSMLRMPSSARPARTSSPTNWKKLTTSSGVPGKRARSSSRCEATPTGQLLVWQMRAMMQPVAIIAIVPKPYSSAPMAAATSTSRPPLKPPSARTITRSRSWFASSVWCVSVRPISHGPPQCLIELTGDAPVPPSWPDTWMMSAPALATPLATVPMPASATSLTLTLAFLLIMCRS